MSKKIGFSNLVKRFEAISPLDKDACQQQYWQKVPVGNLRSFVDSLQQQAQPTFASPESLSEKELPDSFEEIEIDINFEELDDLDSLTPKPQEPQEDKEPWDDWDEDEDEDEDDLFDFEESEDDEDDFIL
jgi:hypothetical protein